ncbi:MAG TPA: universal stress protein [Terriglobales bacterium]|nr:universal stress protein [Terriglobales bacterium]
MRILLAIDGSKFGGAALEEIIEREWPAGSEVRVLSVFHPTPLVPDPVLVLAAAHVETLKEERLRAPRDVANAAEEIKRRAPSLALSTSVLQGNPKTAIVEEAKRWSADLILVGSHGNGAAKLVLGSVAQAVAANAPCSVEIARSKARAAA